MERCATIIITVSLNRAIARYFFGEMIFV